MENKCCIVGARKSGQVKKCIVIPDSFKGTLTSIEICNLAEKSINKIFPNSEVITIPIADGGEGTVDCFLHALGGERVKTIVEGPYHELMTCYYGKIGNIAVIEVAAAAGLPLVEDRKNPALTTTYGVGEQILHAIKKGAREIILGLGGSATNDGGCGCAAALGVKFYDEEGKSFIPTGISLDRISKIDVSGAKTLLRGCKITAMCDVDNPMHGKQGAAYVYGPQKGASEAMVVELDRQLKSLSEAIKRSIGNSVENIPGAGAAGAFGAGAVAFLDAELKPGIESVLDTVKFEDILKGTDIVFTGEGRIDRQSLRGKVIAGVAKRAKLNAVTTVAFAGDICDGYEGIYDMGVDAVFSINRKPATLFESCQHSRQNFTQTFEDVLRLIKASQ